MASSSKDKASIMERPIQLLKDIHHRKELWKIAAKVKDKWVIVKDGKQSFDMVVFDTKGDDIYVMVPNELYEKYGTTIVEKNTYTFQNFQVLNNDEQFKLSEHKYKPRLNGATIINDVNVHNIPDPSPKLKDFAEIHAGKWREDVLYNVIEVLDNIRYTQPHKGSRKVQVNFSLKDLSENILHCTLWEEYAMKFITYTREKSDVGPTIVFMKYAKIKPEGKFPLTVSNTWTTTKLFINENIEEIVEFKKGLDAAIGNGTFAAMDETPSQLMSQSSAGSQYTPEQKFCHKSEVMYLSKIITLSKDTSCVTVVDTIAVKASKNGWYYRACVSCPKAALGDKPPYKCDASHPTEIEILKYRLEVDVSYENTETTFTFWDRECEQLLGISAAGLRDQMVMAGITDPLAFPVIIDTIEGRTLAARVKWQKKWGSASVNEIHQGKEFIDDIKGRIKLPQDCKAALGTTELEDITSNTVDTNVDIIIPTVFLSATDEIDPDISTVTTPSKRTSPSLITAAPNDDSQELIGSKLSSTKMAKHPKME